MNLLKIGFLSLAVFGLMAYPKTSNARITPYTYNEISQNVCSNYINCNEKFSKFKFRKLESLNHQKPLHTVVGLATFNSKNLQEKTCAMPSLDLNTIVHVKNLQNGKVALCQVTNRILPGIKIINLSWYTRKLLDIKKSTYVELSWSYPHCNFYRCNYHRVYAVHRAYRNIMVGMASWYGIGDGFQGLRTANGEIFNTYAQTCAMRFMKMNTIVHIKNLWNGRVTYCRVNDVGPFARGRILDASWAVKHQLGIDGTALVQVSW